MKKNAYNAEFAAVQAAIESALRSAREREAPDACIHVGIAWRAIQPSRDGRLHATCPSCKSKVSRSAFAR